MYERLITDCLVGPTLPSPIVTQGPNVSLGPSVHERDA